MNLIKRAINRLFTKPGKAELSRPIATPSLTVIRQPWHNTISRGVTPTQLASWLSAADLGDADAYLSLAEEMEERDPHYASVLSTRKRAVLGLPRLVESASDDAADVRLADAVRDALLTPALSGLLSGLLDALGKGYSAVELVWDTTITPWVPAYIWRDPRFFRYDRETGQTLRLLDTSNAYDGIDLPPYRFIVHQPRLKMGLPIRGGLARLCAAGHVCALYALEDWLAFAEVFGMPLRLGRYSSAASEDDKAKLKAAVSGLGADAAAVLHESMQIEFQAAASGAGGSDLYERLLDNLHKLVSKAVLGRSDAADATAGKLGNATDSMQVRQDILESDAEELSQTINEQLVRPFIDLNFGPQDRYPVLKLHVPDQEDLTGLVDMLAKLVPLGLRVEQSVIRDKWGLPDPAKDAELLGAPASPTPLAPPAPADGTKPATNRALNRAAAAPDPTAPLVDRLGTEAEPLIETLLEPVRRALEDSADLMDFREKLLELYPEMDGKAFAELMGQALAVADAQGQWEARPPAAAANRVTIVMPQPDETERELSRQLLNELLRK